MANIKQEESFLVDKLHSVRRPRLAYKLAVLQLRDEGCSDREIESMLGKSEDWPSRINK